MEKLMALAQAGPAFATHLKSEKASLIKTDTIDGTGLGSTSVAGHATA